MKEGFKVKANLIEIEEQDFRDFEKQKNDLEDVVHIQLLISGEEALSKNKTGDLGLLKFLNESLDSYARTRLTELLRLHIDEIKPGKSHILELRVLVNQD